jgi:predicted  nucleic acid-binding Zn-ribbon protein
MSFDDMMSSGRGPGVIGMVMALVVLLGFGLLFMFAFDEGLQGGDQSMESVISHQARDIGDYQANIENGQKSLDKVPALLANAKDLARFKRESVALEAKTAELTTAVSAGKADVARVNEAFDSYKEDYRAFVRGKAKGETMDQLVTVSGVVYKNVSIREVTPIGIQIRHDEGQKRIPFEDLPEEMRDHFQFDPSQKDKALADEAKGREEHEAAVAVADKQAEKEMKEQQVLDAAEAKVRAKKRIAEKEAQVVSLQDEVRNLNRDKDRAAADAMAARAAGRMHINKSSGIDGTIRSKENRISALRAEISQMRSAL